MTAVQLVNTDFAEIKSQLIDFLDSQKLWTDYKWTGSNINIILDLISYQSQLVNYTANMLANESFLASASLRNNVVALANTIGYVPSSTKAATITCSFSMILNAINYPDGFPQYLEIRPGMSFTANMSNTAYIFNLMNSIMAPVTTGGFCTFNNVTTYEGYLLKSEFVVNSNIYNQRFIIENPTIDTTSIRVRVKEDPNVDSWTVYIHGDNFVDVSGTDTVYWVNEIDENYYEITFGDGYFGKKLENGAKIEVDYLKSNGELANGIYGGQSYSKNIQFAGQVYDSNGIKVSPTIQFLDDFVSNGGSQIETVSSIKLRAPKFYGAQKRCVITDDYEAIIRQIYPGVDDIYVYGGETLPIPEYGRVYVAIKPSSGQFLSNSTKTYIKNSLEKFRIASLDIRITNPEVIYVEVDSTVYFNNAKTNRDSATITSLVKSTLNSYASSSTVAKFGGAIRFSRIVGAIDDSDPSITRNNTSLRMRRDISPLVNTAGSYEICFENPIVNENERISVWSSGFQLQINGKPDSRIFYFEDDNFGRIRTFYYDSNKEKQIDNQYFGTVDYLKGEILIGYSKSITFINTSTLEIRSIPMKQDIIANNKMYMELDVSKSDILSIPDMEYSG